MSHCCRRSPNGGVGPSPGVPEGVVLSPPDLSCVERGAVHRLPQTPIPRHSSSTDLPRRKEILSTRRIPQLRRIPASAVQGDRFLKEKGCRRRSRSESASHSRRAYFGVTVPAPGPCEQTIAGVLLKGITPKEAAAAAVNASLCIPVSTATALYGQSSEAPCGTCAPRRGKAPSPGLPRQP